MKVYCVVCTYYLDPCYIVEKICSTKEKAEQWLDKHIKDLIGDQDADQYDECYMDLRGNYEIVEEEVD